MRVLNTIVMGSTAHTTLPRRWHADYGTFTGENNEILEGRLPPCVPLNRCWLV